MSLEQHPRYPYLLIGLCWALGRDVCVGRHGALWFAIRSREKFKL